MKASYLTRVREHNPLIHNITNLVSAHFTANGLLAIGASPMMADCAAEVAQLAKVSQALVLNLGTPSPPLVDAMLRAGKAANEAGVPVVLDPIAAGVTQLRIDVIQQLLAEIKMSAIRGNAAEMAHLAGVAWQGKGVDAGSGDANLGEVAQKVAQRCDCVAVLSGEHDFIADASGKVLRLSNGTPLFPKITASGCLLSAVVGAFLAVAEKENALEACLEACATYAVAGEVAAQDLAPTQHGSFMIRLLDTLAAISPECVAEKMVWVEHHD